MKSHMQRAVLRTATNAINPKQYNKMPKFGQTPVLRPLQQQQQQTFSTRSFYTNNNKSLFKSQQQKQQLTYNTTTRSIFNFTKCNVQKQQFNASKNKWVNQISTDAQLNATLAYIRNNKVLRKSPIALLAIAPPLTRDMDIEYYANEQHYKENIEYVETGDIVVNIRQIQRIMLKDAFLCKKYMRYILETIEDAKEMLHMTQRRINMMIEATQHEPTIQVYRRYLLRLDEEIDALDGFMQLGLLTVMPVSNIHKHLFRQIDEEHNEGGLTAEFNLARHQFDVIHEQLNQVAELSNKCDGLVEVVDNVIVDILRKMMLEVDKVEGNKLPHNFEEYNGPEVTLKDNELVDADGKPVPPEMPEYLKTHYALLGIDEQRKQRDEEIRRKRKEQRNGVQEVVSSETFQKRGANMPPFEGFGDDPDDEWSDFIIDTAKNELKLTPEQIAENANKKQ